MEGKKFTASLLCLFLFIMWGFSRGVFAQGIQFDCEATLEAWRHDASLKNFMATHNCKCPPGASRPVCTPISAGSGGYTGSYRSTGDWRTDLMMGLMQSFIQGFMKGLREAQYSKQRHEAEWRERIKKQISDMKEQYRILREEEFKASKERLLSKLKGTETRRTTALKNLKCGYYLSKKALEEKDLELAKKYSSDAALAMEGAISCSENEDLPEVPATVSYDAQFREDFFRVYVMELNDRIEAALSFRKELEKATNKVKIAQEKVKELEARKELIGKNEKEELDSLLAEARKTLEDSIEQENKARENFEKVSQEIQALRELERTVLSMEVKK